MSTNRLYNQFTVIFGSLMTFFYLGIGLYFLFSSNLSQLDKFLRYMVGGTFVFYGSYRLYQTIIKVKEVFFSDRDDESDE